jgi:hypothetical protein
LWGYPILGVLAEAPNVKLGVVRLLPSAAGNARRARVGPLNSSLGGNMETPTVPQNTPNELADDILRGADEIAAFIYGERGSRRKVYYLAECSRLPVFRLGSVLCARKSVLLKWIAGQERRVMDSLG